MPDMLDDVCLIFLSFMNKTWLFFHLKISREKLKVTIRKLNEYRVGVEETDRKKIKKKTPNFHIDYDKKLKLLNLNFRWVSY